MSDCPGCGAHIPEGKQFCPNCGLRVNIRAAAQAQAEGWDAEGSRPSASQPVRCGACGAWSPPGAQFCQACGVLIAPVVTPPPALPMQIPAEGSDAPAGSGAPTGAGERGSRYLQLGNAVFPLAEGGVEFVIGRSVSGQPMSPDIDLEPYLAASAGVSRRHARISIADGKAYLEDMFSTNFTYVNAQQLPPGQRCLLHSGDLLQFGQIQVRYVCEGAE